MYIVTGVFAGMHSTDARTHANRSSLSFLIGTHAPTRTHAHTHARTHICTHAVAFSHTQRTKFFEAFLQYLPMGLGHKAHALLGDQYNKFQCQSMHAAGETLTRAHVRDVT